MRLWRFEVWCTSPIVQPPFVGVSSDDNGRHLWVGRVVFTYWRYYS